LLKAIKNNDETFLKKLINFPQVDSKLLNTLDINHQSLLLYAKNKEILKLLIENGADVNIKMAYSRTPLIVLVQYRDKDIIELLLESGADINAVDEIGETVLMYISKKSYEFKNRGEIAKILLDRGADINVRDKYDNSAYMWALEKNHKDLVEFLIDQGIEKGPIGRSLRSKYLTQIYSKENEITIKFDDSTLNIHWPEISEYVLSEKDRLGIDLNQAFKLLEMEE
jgi:ankyrin repeat protein